MHGEPQSAQLGCTNYSSRLCIDFARLHFEEISNAKRCRKETFVWITNAFAKLSLKHAKFRVETFTRDVQITSLCGRAMASSLFYLQGYHPKMVQINQALYPYSWKIVNFIITQTFSSILGLQITVKKIFENCTQNREFSIFPTESAVHMPVSVFMK